MLRRKTALKEAFSALMTADSAEVAAAVSRLTARLRQQQHSGKPLTPTEQLALRLNSQYPDVTATPSATCRIGCRNIVWCVILIADIDATCSAGHAKVTMKTLQVTRG